MDNQQFSQPLTVPPPAPIISSLPGGVALLRQAWAILKQRFSTFLGVVAIPILIASVFIIVLSVGGFFGLSLLSTKFAAGGVVLLLVLLVVFVLVIIIGQIWAQTALLHAVIHNQEKIGVIESYRRGWHKVFPYLWVSFLSGLIIVGGFLLFIVPGIIFAIWFSLAFIVLVSEDMRGMNALLKSREYVTGRWGSVFWRLIFIGIVSYLVSLIPAFIFLFLETSKILEVVRIIISFSISLLFTPLMMIYLFLIYSHLKSIKGEIAFAPTGRKKGSFVFVGIIGVLIIPAILLSLVFLSLGSAKGKARDAKRQADIMQLQSGLELYHRDHNSYPASLSELLPTYFPSQPVDPSTNQPYQYESRLNGAGYKVCAQLESIKTPKCAASKL